MDHTILSAAASRSRRRARPILPVLAGSGSRRIFLASMRPSMSSVASAGCPPRAPAVRLCGSLRGGIACDEFIMSRNRCPFWGQVVCGLGETARAVRARLLDD
jgi:hypothetical protein